jgi:hypothetical protein
MNETKKPDGVSDEDTLIVVLPEAWWSPAKVSDVAFNLTDGGFATSGWTVLAHAEFSTPERTTRSRYTLAPRTPAYVWGIVLLLVLLALVRLFPINLK